MSQPHDPHPAPDYDQRPVHITREIPLWGIITVLGAFAGQAVALYYSNAGLAKSFEEQNTKLTSVAADVRAINAELNQNNLRNAQSGYRLDDLTRRVTAIELVLSTPTPRAPR
jgi:hypothetical protein